MKRLNMNLGTLSVTISIVFGLGFWVVMFAIYGLLEPGNYPGRFALRFIFFTSFLMIILGMLISFVGLMSEKQEKANTGKGFILNGE